MIMANMQDGFNDFYNEFKEWTKEQILHRTYDICLENADKDREIERFNNTLDEIESIVYANMSNIDARISIQETLDKLKEQTK